MYIAVLTNGKIKENELENYIDIDIRYHSLNSDCRYISLI